MSSEMKKGPEFVELPPMTFDLSDPEQRCKYAELLFRPFGFDRKRPPETTEANSENSSDAPVEQKS